MTKIKHVLGISGGKDSAALAIYLKNKYPTLDIEYYFCETGKELKETYNLITALESVLGKRIKKLKAAPDYEDDVQFDVFLNKYGGYLPSSNSRWCTRALKLEPFEKYVGETPTLSYVGIRGDENREGYISQKPNIQSIFPFRKNIWSEEIISKTLTNSNIKCLTDITATNVHNRSKDEFIKIISEPISYNYDRNKKLNDLLTISISSFNKIVYEYMKSLNYPISHLNEYPLLENEDNLVREDIFRILEESGVGLPKYYDKLEFELDGQKGYYARSRSGCYFCFFQQKIEWVWLYENHRELFSKAIDYEKDGYTWMQDERLEDLIKPDRIKQIKEYHLKRTASNSNSKSSYLIDILEEAESEGCAACFI
ncbi:MAG TPA: phosphoadenosine phosphosulfate reductase [Ignavibacteriales bacterium]|nr:phosphoadenosine phosphosulfate reductase [Ignavibacteriales bacterium]